MDLIAEIPFAALFAPGVVVAHAAQVLDAVAVFVMIGRNHAAFAAGGDVLQGVERERAEVTDASRHASLVGCACGMGAVLKHLEPVFPRNLHNRVHIHHKPGVVDYINSLGFIRDLFRDFRRVDVEGARINIGKYGDSAFLEDRQRGCQESIRSHDDFVTGLDVENLRSDVHRCGAVGTGECVFDAVDLCEFILELLRLRPHCECILPHCGDRGIALRIVIDTAHERIGDFQLDAVIRLIRTGDAAFGFASGEMFLVYCVDRHDSSSLLEFTLIEFIVTDKTCFPTFCIVHKKFPIQTIKQRRKRQGG